MKWLDLQNSFIDIIYSNNNLTSNLIFVSENQINRKIAYSRNYSLGLSSHLLEVYPSVEKSVGEDNFSALCKEYISGQPSSEPTLTFYGRNFGSFISNHPYFKEFIFLKDLAAVDWLMYECNFLMNNQNNFTKIDEIIFNTSHLKLAPSVRFYGSNIAIYDLWRALSANVDIDDLELNNEQSVLIFKNDSLQPKLHLLDTEETFFFNALTKNTHLSLELFFNNKDCNSKKHFLSRILKNGWLTLL